MTGQACTDCGAVFNIRLNEPEKFKSFVDYAAQVRGGIERIHSSVSLSAARQGL